ncbi:hypothetical protein KUTeg_013902 [Tegillarca granosa]|uniref:Uncharacterized protein n=1 Tax=Tegillarca granosa TaxID=220873 RepID=A0ABQ9F0G5_TEGGR|nr:hypothetical protein KUTeg_013902 [Tegillarca granosa]
MQNLAITEATTSKSKPLPAPSKTPAKPVVQTDLKSAPSISVTSPAKPSLLASTSKAGVSSSEAAANWIKQAQNESAKGPSNAVSAAAAALSHLSPEELQKRQQYLKEQRDKLLEMKKKEREKQLLTAEKSQPQRPMSARAAKSALSKSGGPESSSKQLSPEEEKKLAMRKAIAVRLKSEVLGQK